ncbi:MAG: ASCH domain-containing protein [archaeon]|nr:ASCH domain-containing protein [archaeon]
MKTLSLKQPWAELVVNGKKKIELRKWNTNFRGEFLVHASLSPDNDAMKRFGFEDNSLALGAIVGKSKLLDVKEYKNKEDFQKDAGLHLATNEWGTKGFLLESSLKFDKPIPAKGKLNFWNFEGKL